MAESIDELLGEIEALVGPANPDISQEVGTVATASQTEGAERPARTIMEQKIDYFRSSLFPKL